jgi:toxin ParE1/3/4
VTSLHLTDRALSDIDDIESFSVERWGARVAAQYQNDLGAALARLGECPDLLREHPEYPGRLRFYHVREHVLVCDVLHERIFILTVWHGAMDFLGRLHRLEPQLVHEAELLARQIDTR